ncbi:hypothetical protein Bpfe_001694 [Biomphalaria pfeifferi]|uniref:Uncharacterized protein n=1 Tax=Biomphalaria pfeifferi TaxID=112525 RepID=A0AAD8C966_BIOPF|nr:hypothetical protein Bpfe_001694 [Biomphalaria pfeifferi]
MRRNIIVHLLEQMYNSVKEVPNPELKALEGLVDTQCEQSDSKNEGYAPSLNIELLPVQGCDTNSYNGDGGNNGAECESDNKSYECGSHEKKPLNCCNYLNYE